MSNQNFYTVAEIAERWKISHDKVTRVFRDKPGVLNLGSEANLRRRKRGYAILRIPLSVLLEVENELAA